MVFSLNNAGYSLPKRVSSSCESCNACLAPICSILHNNNLHCRGVPGTTQKWHALDAQKAPSFLKPRPQHKRGWKQVAAASPKLIKVKASVLADIATDEAVTLFFIVRTQRKFS